MPLRLQSFLKAFLQLAACLLLFYAITGGALLHSREQHVFLSGHAAFYETLRISAVVLLFFLWTAASFFKLGPGSLEPLRSIKYFSANHPGKSVLFLTFLFFTGHFSSLCLMHQGMGTALWDTGYYDDVIWNSAKGLPLISSARGGISILGDHFKPLLLLLAPVYWFQSSMVPVFFIFSAASAACIPLTYLLGKEITGSKQASLAFVACVFFYQPLRNAVDFPLHTVTLADPLLLLAFYCFLKDKVLCGLFACLLVLGCKENMVMEVLGVGLYFIFSKKKSGWATAGLAVGVFVFAAAVINPAFKWAYEPIKKWDFYEHFIHWTPELWARLLQPNPLVFIFLIFAPFLFLPVFAKNIFWLLSPTLAMRLLNSLAGFRMITGHYTSGLTSLTAIGAILGYSRAQNFKYGRFLLPGLIFSSLIFMGQPSLFKIEGYLWEASSAKNQHFSKILETIPESYSVKAPETFFAHVTHRAHKFTYSSIIAGSPLESISENPDLFIVDELRSGPEQKKAEQIYSGKNYKLGFDAGELKIYTRKDFEIPRDVILQWQNILQSPAVAYRKTAVKIYKILFFAGLFLLVAFLIRREYYSAKV